MKNVLIDTNILLDVCLKREPFYTNSIRFLSHIEQNGITGAIASTTITNIYYILRKMLDKETALEHIQAIAETERINFLPVSKQTVKLALDIPMYDFEDAIQVAVAVEAGINLIVTRNLRDFKNSPIASVLPEDFLVM